MTKEQMKRIAEQVLEGKKLHDIDFGVVTLNLDEKLSLIDKAIRLYPVPESKEIEGKEGDNCMRTA